MGSACEVGHGATTGTNDTPKAEVSSERHVQKSVNDKTGQSLDTSGRVWNSCTRRNVFSITCRICVAGGRNGDR